MKTAKLLSIILASLLINGCAPLKAPVITKSDSFQEYKYFFITPTKSLESSTSGVYGGQNGVYGSSTSKSINPGDVISGILIKKGLIRIPELKPELADETFIVNYGESGRRNRGLGYTIEVTIQCVSANSHTPICTCTAEGQGETEADDIRQAITRCLSALLSNEN